MVSVGNQSMKGLPVHVTHNEFKKSILLETISDTFRKCILKTIATIVTEHTQLSDSSSPFNSSVLLSLGVLGRGQKNVGHF